MKVDYKPLPVSKVRSVVGQRRVKYRKIVWHTAEMYVKTFLTLTEFRQLIDTIIQTCFAEDGTLVYELIDFATRVNIIAAYALIELPEDIDELFYVVYESDLYGTVAKNINKDQLDAVLTTLSQLIWQCGGDLA